MADILVKYYKYISTEQGIEGKMKLAFETKVPSMQAAVTPDTPEIIEKFKKAIEKLTGKPCPNL